MDSKKNTHLTFKIMARKRNKLNHNNRGYELVCTAKNGTISYFKKLATNPVANEKEIRLKQCLEILQDKKIFQELIY